MTQLRLVLALEFGGLKGLLPLWAGDRLRLPPG